MIQRRSFLRGMLGLLAAPAIVRVASLMPVSVQPLNIITNVEPIATGWDGLSLKEIVEIVIRDGGEALRRNVEANNALMRRLNGQYDNLPPSLDHWDSILTASYERVA